MNTLLLELAEKLANAAEDYRAIIPQFHAQNRRKMKARASTIDEVIAALRTAASEGGELPEFERIKLWFFRDLGDAQRMQLFALCGFKDAIDNGELRTMAAQRLVLTDHVLKVTHPPEVARDAGRLDFLDRPFVSVVGREPDVQTVEVSVGEGNDAQGYSAPTIREAIDAALRARAVG